MSSLVGLGLMSGTSMDGIDAVVARFSAKGDETLAHVFQPYPRSVREILFQKVNSPQITLEDFGVLDYLVGEAFAKAAQKCLTLLGKKHRGAKVDAIGSHGQTIFHNPEKKVSLQIGNPQVIAQTTGITTVSNFRMADIIAGGEGAPLLPYYHRRIARQALSSKQWSQGFAVHNLGGISNFTYFGPKEKLLALDTGPANCLMDISVQMLSQGKLQYDANARWANAGKISRELLRFLEEIPAVQEYRARPAPKSTGRELFSQQMALQAISEAKRHGLDKEDIIATLAQFSVDLMVEAYERFVLKKKLPLSAVIFCGGGAKNPFLLKRFAESLPHVEVRSLEELGTATQAVEAQAFALFGLMAITGRAQSLPAATGAKNFVVGGEITPGDNWRDLYLKVDSASRKNVSILQ